MEYYPRIASVSPNNGSAAGGATLTIQGSGFSMDERKNSVEVGGRGWWRNVPAAERPQPCRDEQVLYLQ